MNSALIIEGVVLILGFYFLGYKKPDISRKNYIFIIISLLIIESGLRAPTVGPDTMNYYSWFEDCKYLSWHSVFNNTSGDRDPGFSVVMKICQLVSNDFNFFLTIGALWFFIPLGIILYRYSSHVLQLVFAFTLYLSLFHIIALSGIRQQFAMGFSFFAYLLFDKDKYILGSLLLIIGLTIHASLLLFTAVPVIHFFVNKKLYKPLHLLTLLSLPIIIVGARIIIIRLAGLMSDDYYMSYSETDNGGGVVYVALMELLSLFCFIAIKRDHLEKNLLISYLYINLPLMTFFVPMILVDGGLIRMGQYFTLYMMLLFPYAIDLFAGKKNRWILYLISILILVVFISRSSIEYEFCF